MKTQKYERKYAWFEGDTKRIAAVIKNVISRSRDQNIPTPPTDLMAQRQTGLNILFKNY